MTTTFPEKSAASSTDDHKAVDKAGSKPDDPQAEEPKSESPFYMSILVVGLICFAADLLFRPSSSPETIIRSRCPLGSYVPVRGPAVFTSSDASLLDISAGRTRTEEGCKTRCKNCTDCQGFFFMLGPWFENPYHQLSMLDWTCLMLSSSTASSTSILRTPSSNADTEQRQEEPSAVASSVTVPKECRVATTTSFYTSCNTITIQETKFSAPTETNLLKEGHVSSSSVRTKVSFDTYAKDEEGNYARHQTPLTRRCATTTVMKTVFVTSLFGCDGSHTHVISKCFGKVPSSTSIRSTSSTPRLTTALYTTCRTIVVKETAAPDSDQSDDDAVAWSLLLHMWDALPKS